MRLRFRVDSAILLADFFSVVGAGLWGLTCVGSDAKISVWSDARSAQTPKSPAWILVCKVVRISLLFAAARQAYGRSNVEPNRSYSNRSIVQFNLIALGR